jgi:hypothetical protein
LQSLTLIELKMTSIKNQLSPKSKSKLILKSNRRIQLFNLLSINKNINDILYSFEKKKFFFNSFFKLFI